MGRPLTPQDFRGDTQACLFRKVSTEKQDLNKDSDYETKLCCAFCLKISIETLPGAFISNPCLHWLVASTVLLKSTTLPPKELIDGREFMSWYKVPVLPVPRRGRLAGTWHLQLQATRQGDAKCSCSAPVAECRQ